VTSAGRLSVWLTAAALAASLASVFAGPSGGAAAASPLTNEDIVRLVASGAAEGEIEDAIRARPEAFDLADDMVDELKLAGVSASIVDAMRRRRAESKPPAPLPERPRAGRVHLVVTLNAGAGGPRTLRVPAWADEDVKARLQLPKESEQRRVKDLAVFLACGAPEHVPDLWRSKSPLGRDMVGVPRHEMLAFVAGDTPEGKTPRLVVPARIEAEVDDTEPHDLMLGIAARIGDHWMQLAVARLPRIKIDAATPAFLGRIAPSGHAFEFKVELTAPRSPGS
jgi:hypothetical protein